MALRHPRVLTAPARGKERQGLIACRINTPPSNSKGAKVLGTNPQAPQSVKAPIRKPIVKSLLLLSQVTHGKQPMVGDRGRGGGREIMFAPTSVEGNPNVDKYILDSCAEPPQVSLGVRICCLGQDARTEHITSDL